MSEMSFGVDPLGEYVGRELTFRWVPTPDQCEHEWQVVNTITDGQHEARLAKPFEVCPRCRWSREVEECAK